MLVLAWTRGVLIVCLFYSGQTLSLPYLALWPVGPHNSGEMDSCQCFPAICCPVLIRFWWIMYGMPVQKDVFGGCE